MKTSYLYYLYLIILSIGFYSCAQNKSIIELGENEKLIEFTTDSFTLPNLQVTPDKKHIIFNVLGDIYRVPLEGGMAKVLLQDNFWKRGAKLSPDGKTLAYTSDETGEFQVWTYNLNSKEKKVYPVVESTHYALYAYWDAAGNLLIPSIEGLKKYNLISGEETLLRKAKESEKSIMHSTNRKMSLGNSGEYAFFQADSALWAFDLTKKRDQYIGPMVNNRKDTYIHVSPNNKLVLYYNQAHTGDIALTKWDLNTDEVKSLFKVRNPGYTTKIDYEFDFIDDKSIILNKEGKIVKMNLETNKVEPIPIKVEIKKVIKKPLHQKPQYIRDSIITASVLRNPVTRRGLDTLYFSALGKLHSYAQKTGEITQIHPNKDQFEFFPGLSGDGKYLVYSTWTDSKMGHIWVRELETGKEYQVTQKPGLYINPTWSADNKQIVFLSDETETKMGIGFQGRNSLQTYFLDIYNVRVTVQKEGIKFENSEKIKRVTPSVNGTRRFYPVLTFTKNGKSIYTDTYNPKTGIPNLMEIDLASKDILKESPLPFYTEEAAIAPDARHTAFIFNEQIWIDAYPYVTDLQFHSEAQFLNKRRNDFTGVADILFPHAKLIYEVAPSYLYWQDKNTLLWGSGTEVYEYDILTEKTTKIADIKVQEKRAIPKAQYALTNARIITIDKEDRIIEKGSVLVKNNRIKAVGSSKEVAIPKNYKVFDLNGKTIIPGLIDVHAHYRSSYEGSDQQYFKYIGNLAYGVTTIYDPSVESLSYKEQAQLVETGQLLGPRIFASGNAITNNPAEIKYQKLETQEDANRVVSSLVKLGGSGPIKEYDVINSHKRGLLHKAAEKYGLGITTHQGDFEQSLGRIIMGYTAIEHEIGSFPLQKDAVSLIGKSGVNYTPTFIVTPGLTKFYYNENSKREEKKLLRFAGKVFYHNHYGMVNENTDPKYQTTINAMLKYHAAQHKITAKNLREIVNSDGKVSVGGHGNPLPGIGTHWEIWFMAKGMNNYQALEAATINGAEKLDLQEEIGSLEKGKLADMVVLYSNPLDNIYNTTDILYTIQNGNIYEAEDMKQTYPIEEELRPWGRDSPIVLKSMDSIFIR